MPRGRDIMASVQRSRHHLILLAAVGVWMFWAAGHFTVFDDEAFSCRRYVLPAGEMVSLLWHGVEPDPPLYYLLQNVWVRIFGVGRPDFAACRSFYFWPAMSS